MKSSKLDMYVVQPDATNWCCIMRASKKLVLSAARNILAGVKHPDMYVPTRWDGSTVIGARLARDTEIVEAAEV